MQKVYLFQNGNISKITQSRLDTFSHKNVEAIDFSNGAINAPCDVKVVANGHWYGGRQVYFESTQKVFFADGTQDYLCFYIEHLNADIAVGKVFKQNSKIANEGNYGLSGGIHAHIISGKGKISKSNLTFSECGTNQAPDYFKSYKPNAFKQVDPQKLYCLKTNTKIEYYFGAGKMNFKKESDVKMPTDKAYCRVVYYFKDELKYCPKSMVNYVKMEVTQPRGIYFDKELKNKVNAEYKAGDKYICKKVIGWVGKYFIHESETTDGKTCYIAYKMKI